MTSRGAQRSKRTGRPVSPIVLTPAERRTLDSWSRLTRDTPWLVGQRARIILRAAAGMPGVAIAAELRISAQTVCTWRARFVARRLDGLWSARERVAWVREPR